MQNLLTIKQVAEILQVKDTTIYDWVYKGQIRHVKLGRMLRFFEEDILNYINSNVVEKWIV